ncbi:MAG: 2OG-Fe dioxygenase family protein [Planctomycetes bacterium]|nr:2OG-Fe dioxygenase family protein [Planctomycetota bacterium]
MPPGQDFDFSLHRLPLAVGALAPFFARLPLDRFIAGTFRRRRLSRFRGAGAFEHLPHAAFMQSAYVNRLLGNIQREYEELEDDLIAHPAFRALLTIYAEFFATGPDTVLGVHQIRIVCAPGQSGEPAPEGVHQDGFDWVGIFCIARAGVLGAQTQLFDDLRGEPIFSKALAPGEAVFVNDRRIHHFTTPVTPSADAEGHRDVFVITS